MKLWADAAGRYRSSDGDPDLVNAAGGPQAVDAISSYSRNMSSWPSPAAARAAAAAGESNGPFDLAALDAETNNIKTTLKYPSMMRDNKMTNNSVYKAVKFPLIPDRDTISSSVPALEDPRMPDNNSVTVAALKDSLMPDDSMVNNLAKALNEPVMQDNSMANNFTEALNNSMIRDNSMVTNFVEALNDPVMQQDNSVVNNFAEALNDAPMRDNSVVNNNFAPTTLKDTPMRGNGVVKDFKAILKDRLIRHKNMFTLAQGMMYSNAFASIDSGAVESTRPKRRNVKISKDPQSVAARLRREKISDRIRVLQSLVPGGSKMDTASMLDEAINYVKFLKAQVQTLETVSSAAAGGFDLRHQNPLSCGPGPLYRHSPFLYSPTMSMDCATVVSQGLSSAAPSSDHFDTLFPPPGAQILSYSSSFPDNTYREQFCH